MPPAQGQPQYMQPQGNDQVLQAIQALRTDITAEMDKRFQEQQSTLEERFKPVEEIQGTLEQARKNQEEAQERLYQQQQQQNPWQPKTWDDVIQRGSDLAYQRMEKERQDRESQEERTRQLTVQEEAEYEADLDRQLSELEKGGYLSPVGNANDFNDRGNSERRELLAAAAHMGTPDLKVVADNLSEHHKHNVFFDAETKTYKDATGTLTPLPGKYAPVGNSSGNSFSGWSGPTQTQIHNMSMDELVSLSEMQGGGPVPTTTYRETGF